MVNTLPAGFSQAVTQLHTQAEQIRALAGNQAITTQGATAVKMAQREQLEATMIKVNNALKAQAAADNDVRLKAAVDISPSSIAKLRENDFITRIKLIYDEATAIGDKLQVWGITQADIETLNIQSNAFPERTPDIRTVKAKRTQSTAAIGEKIKETARLLRDTIDPMMLPFQTINPDFYGQYRATRTIIDRTASQTVITPPPSNAQTQS